MSLLDFVKFYPVVLIHASILLDGVHYVQLGHMFKHSMFMESDTCFSFLGKEKRKQLSGLSKKNIV